MSSEMFTLKINPETSRQTRKRLYSNKSAEKSSIAFWTAMSKILNKFSSKISTWKFSTSLKISEGKLPTLRTAICLQAKPKNLKKIKTFKPFSKCSKKDPTESPNKSDKCSKWSLKIKISSKGSSTLTLKSMTKTTLPKSTPKSQPKTNLLSKTTSWWLWFDVSLLETKATTLKCSILKILLIWLTLTEKSFTFLAYQAKNRNENWPFQMKNFTRSSTNLMTLKKPF